MDFSFQEMLLFLQHKQMNVLCGLHTLGNPRLGSWSREGLDIFLKAFRPCANHLVLRVKEDTGEIATGGKNTRSHGMAYGGSGSLPAVEVLD